MRPDSRVRDARRDVPGQPASLRRRVPFGMSRTRIHERGPAAAARSADPLRPLLFHSSSVDEGQPLPRLPYGHTVSPEGAVLREVRGEGGPLHPGGPSDGATEVGALTTTGSTPGCRIPRPSPLPAGSAPLPSLPVKEDEVWQTSRISQSSWTAPAGTMGGARWCRGARPGRFEEAAWRA